MAHAGTATLWACHGPAGQALGMAGLAGTASGDGETTLYGSGCDGPVGGLADGGVRAALGRPDPIGGSQAAWRVAVPAQVALTGVLVTRRTPVFGTGAAFTASSSDGVLESGTDTALDGVLARDATGTALELAVACALPDSDRCATPGGTSPGVDIGAIGLRIDDVDAPRGAVGGVVSPAVGGLALAVRATDVGLGLARLRADVDGTLVALADVGGDGCAELSAQDASVDLPLDAACPPRVTDVVLPVDTTRFADGEHRLTVTAIDATGNAAVLADETITVANVRTPHASSALVTLGSGAGAGAGADGGSGGGGGAGGSGGVGGQGGTDAPGAASSCRAPRLTMKLSTRPLRRVKSVAVLRKGGRYRYTGRLTCVVGGRRVAAPGGSVISIRNTIGRRTYVRNGVTTARNGAVSVILAYRSARLIRFRFRASDGVTVQVNLRIRVATR